MSFRFKAKAESAVIDITDLIGMGGFYADDMRAELNKAKGVKNITVRLTTDGGDITQGLACYGMLRGHGARIRVEVLGVAASMGSVIAMAGDEIAMAEDAFLMIHNPASVIDGEEQDLRDRADLLAKMKATLVSIYARRTGQEPAAIEAAMAAETWMTAQEALALGYCTEVISASNLAARVRNFRNTPKALQRATKAKGKQMDLADMIALLGMKEDATEEECVSAIQALQSKASNAADDDEDKPGDEDDDEDDDEKPPANETAAARAKREAKAALRASKGNKVLNAVLALAKKVDGIAVRVDGDERDRIIAANIKKFNAKTEKQARSWPLATLKAFVRDADDLENDDAPGDDGTPRGPSALRTKEIVLTAEDKKLCALNGTDPAKVLEYKKAEAAKKAG